jgi:hypothetical protein
VAKAEIAVLPFGDPWRNPTDDAQPLQQSTAPHVTLPDSWQVPSASQDEGLRVHSEYVKSLTWKYRLSFPIDRKPPVPVSQAHALAPPPQAQPPWAK